MPRQKRNPHSRVMPNRRVDSPGRLALALVVASLVFFDGGFDAGVTAEPHAFAAVPGPRTAYNKTLRVLWGGVPPSWSPDAPGTRVRGVAVPPTAPQRASSEPEYRPARLDPQGGAAGGSSEQVPPQGTPPPPPPPAGPLTDDATVGAAPPVPESAQASTVGVAAAGDPAAQAGAPPPRPPDGWMKRAGAAVATGGWAVGQFLRTGRWSGDARTVFERDSRTADTDQSEFAVGRRSSQAAVSLRNSQLVFGPRLLIGNAGLDVAVLRDAYRLDGNSSPGTGRVVGYDVGTTALPDRRYSVGVSAARTQTVLPVLFGTSRDQLMTQRGATMKLRGPLLDSILEWRQSRSEARARTESTVLRDGEDRTVLSYAGTRQSSRQSLDLEYRHEDRTDLVYPDFSYPLQFSNLRHSWLLDEGTDRRSLTTTLAFSRRGGNLPTDYLRGETRLDYRLRPTLHSRTIYRRDRVDAKTFGRDQQAVDTQLQHRLYDSLITTAAGRFSHDDLRTGERQLRGATLQLDYRKKLVAGGRLSASAGRRWDREDNRFSGREDIVLREAQEARLGVPIRLRRDRVVPGTIVVTDATGTVVYREGFDYTVDFIGDFAEISIRPDGRILDGRTLLVDYRVRVSPFTETSTTQPQYDLAIDYGWINPYVQFNATHRELVSGFDDGTVFDRTTRTQGVNLRWNPGRSRIQLRNERRTEDARNLSYESIQFGQLVSYALGPGRVLTANLDEVRIDFKTPVRRETRASVQVDFRWQATPGLSLAATSSARLRRDTAGFDESLYQAGAETSWERGALRVSMLAARDWGERERRSFEGLRVSIRASRSFWIAPSRISLEGVR